MSRKMASSYFRLGDKRQRRDRRKNHDIGPAGVVGHHQHAFTGHRLADHLDMHAEQRGDQAMIAVGKSPRRPHMEF